ncbi:MAG: hypothetical protein M1322_03980 [Candidatus Parvarchaeota archaeon]|jgi:hypothetical protein|nr:hypothetical protein [Candidatus Parvarchaeota archaeon]MCL5107238.1 hypothetical protein [Candidatus Parvarchaeota archaeon]
MKTLVVKIHFEMDKNIKRESAAMRKIYEWADNIFPSGYTVYKTKGVWKGKARESFTIERYEKNMKFARNPRFLKEVKKLAKDLNQKEIIVTTFTADMITAG